MEFEIALHKWDDAPGAALLRASPRKHSPRKGDVAPEVEVIDVTEQELEAWDLKVPKYISG